MPALGEFLHPMIEGIGDVDVLLGVKGDTGGAVELPLTLAVLAPTP